MRRQPSCLCRWRRFSPPSRASITSTWTGAAIRAISWGDKIHRFARITAIADVYDALAPQRSYKPV